MMSLTPTTGFADRPGQAPEPILVGAGLVKMYPNSPQPALNGLDIAVGAGEIFGLLGPNGAGKTTAISLLSTVLDPTRGAIHIDHLDVSQATRRVRRLIGLVPQHIALYLNLTAKENLRFFGRLQGLSGKDLEDRIGAVLALTGLTEKADHRVSTYSGGMQRRLNYAVGVLHRPKVLFLDEPTVGIDAQSRNLIFEQLSVLRQQQAAVVYTTHYMEEAEAICDRVLIIDEGRAITYGRPQDLIDQHPECRNLGELFLSLTGKKLRD